VKVTVSHSLSKIKISFEKQILNKKLDKISNPNIDGRKTAADTPIVFRTSSSSLGWK